MDPSRILTRNYRPVTKKWTVQSATYKNRIKNRLANFLQSLSGNDVPAMLVDCLNGKTLNECPTKYKDALNRMSYAVNNKIKQKSKHNFIRPLREAKLTHNEVLELGFQCGTWLWEKCLSNHARHLGGKPSLSEKNPEEVAIIREHMESIANEASNRSVQVKVYERRDPTVLFKKKK